VDDPGHLDLSEMLGRAGKRKEPEPERSAMRACL
jgi:hypothetical protein